MVAELASQRLSAKFIEDYAKQFDRPEASAHPQRRRELEVILEREMLLAMTARAAALMEGNALRRRGGTSAADSPSAFLRDLADGIARESGWTAGDAMEFRADLGVYQNLAAVAASRSRERGSRRVAGGPFVDRCAILLDPSMIENASRAAGNLLRQLEAKTDQLFVEVMPGPKRG
jgi:hypothetical protein